MTRPAGAPEVIVLGGAAMDWVARVDALPEPDGLVVAHAYDRYPGGSAANVAVGVARLGRPVAFVGRLGDDPSGRALLDAFAGEGVDTAQVIIEGGKPTAGCFIGVDRQGERMIFSLPGVSLLEDPAGLAPDAWQGSRVLYIGPSYPAVALAAVGAARQAGSTIVFAPGGGWDSQSLESLRPVLAQVDLLLLSSSDARGLTGLSSITEALDSLPMIVAPSQGKAPGELVIVVTQGASGTGVWEAGQWYTAPAFSVPMVRDTTGAGDAFAAGLLVGFLEGMSWVEAARLGNAAAALKIPHLGARSGLPTRIEVARAMECCNNYKECL